MKIDLKKLAKYEEQYKDSPITLDTLRLMVGNALNYDGAPFALAPNNIATAITTLSELKILVESNAKPVQQLNS